VSSFVCCCASVFHLPDNGATWSMQLPLQPLACPYSQHKFRTHQYMTGHNSMFKTRKLPPYRRPPRVHIVAPCAKQPLVQLGGACWSTIPKSGGLHVHKYPHTVTCAWLRRKRYTSCAWVRTFMTHLSYKSTQGIVRHTAEAQLGAQ
jgi:hypothetical protein